VGAEIGVPFLANDGGAKAYVHSLGEALHYEFKPRGVYVTVVPPPLTNTAMLAKLGVRPADHADEADERGAVRIRGP
jgi:uncharacterized protein